MNFQELLDHFKTQTEIAKAGGISPQVVSAWKARKRIPPYWQLAFEEITSGALKAERLRHRQGQGVTQAD